MNDAKTYLNVPYAQKDAAKALGARWDPINKKWYVPIGKDISPFAQWFMDTETLTHFLLADAQPKSNSASKPVSTTTHRASGVFTYPSIENFVAYTGDEPPWD